MGSTEDFKYWNDMGKYIYKRNFEVVMNIVIQLTAQPVTGGRQRDCTIRYTLCCTVHTTVQTAQSGRPIPHKTQYVSHHCLQLTQLG